MQRWVSSCTGRFQVSWILGPTAKHEHGCIYCLCLAPAMWWPPNLQWADPSFFPCGGEVLPTLLSPPAAELPEGSASHKVLLAKQRWEVRAPSLMLRSCNKTILNPMCPLLLCLSHACSPWVTLLSAACKQHNCAYTAAQVLPPSIPHAWLEWGCFDGTRL